MIDYPMVGGGGSHEKKSSRGWVPGIPNTVGASSLESTKKREKDVSLQAGETAESASC